MEALHSLKRGVDDAWLKGSYCPVCQYPFKSQQIGSPLKHISKCRRQSSPTKKECSDGISCVNLMETHYKLYSHKALAEYRRTLNDSSETQRFSESNEKLNEPFVKLEPSSQAPKVAPQAFIDLTDSPASSDDFNSTQSQRNGCRSSCTFPRKTSPHCPNVLGSSQRTSSRKRKMKLAETSRCEKKRSRQPSQISSSQNRSVPTGKSKMPGKGTPSKSKFEEKKSLSENPWTIAASQAKKRRTPLKKIQIKTETLDGDVIDLTGDDSDIESDGPSKTSQNATERVDSCKISPPSPNENEIKTRPKVCRTLIPPVSRNSGSGAVHGNLPTSEGTSRKQGLKISKYPVIKIVRINLSQSQPRNDFVSSNFETDTEAEPSASPKPTKNGVKERDVIAHKSSIVSKPEKRMGSSLGGDVLYPLAEKNEIGAPSNQASNENGAEEREQISGVQSDTQNISAETTKRQKLADGENGGSRLYSSLKQPADFSKGDRQHASSSMSNEMVDGITPCRFPNGVEAKKQQAGEGKTDMLFKKSNKSIPQDDQMPPETRPKNNPSPVRVDGRKKPVMSSGDAVNNNSSDLLKSTGLNLQSTQARSMENSSTTASTLETQDSEDWGVLPPRGPGFAPVSPIKSDSSLHSSPGLVVVTDEEDFFTVTSDFETKSDAVLESDVDENDNVIKTSVKISSKPFNNNSNPVNSNEVSSSKTTSISSQSELSQRREDQPVCGDSTFKNLPNKGKSGTTHGEKSVRSTVSFENTNAESDCDSFDCSLLMGLTEAQTLPLGPKTPVSKNDRIEANVSVKLSPIIRDSQTVSKPSQSVGKQRVSPRSKSQTSKSQRTSTSKKIPNETQTKRGACTYQRVVGEILHAEDETSQKANCQNASVPPSFEQESGKTGEAALPPSKAVPDGSKKILVKNEDSCTKGFDNIEPKLCNSTLNPSSFREPFSPSLEKWLKSGSNSKLKKQGDIGSMLFGMKPKKKAGTDLQTKDVSLHKSGSNWKRNGFHSGGNSNRKCPFYKKVSGTDIAVDAFSYGVIDGIKFYFLSHFHSDHYMGLNKKTWKEKVYCGKVTGNLVAQKLGLSEEFIVRLPMCEEIKVGDVTVILLEANHCPGAVLFLFKLRYNRVILHTGDFRAFPEMEEYKALQGVKVETLYLDTTYLNPDYQFPLQRDVINAAISIATDEITECPKTLFVVGTYLIGKERIFAAIAKAVASPVFVAADKFRTIQCLEDEELSQMVTKKADGARVHVAPMRALNVKELGAKLSKYSQFERIVAIRPTGWTHDKGHPDLSQIRPDVSGRVRIYGLPYSEHSSFEDLRRFVKYLRPSKIIPTVNVWRKESRDMMNHYLNKWKVGLDP